MPSTNATATLSGPTKTAPSSPAATSTTSTKPSTSKKCNKPAPHFVGTHDFEAFKGRLDERENTTRTIFACNIHRRGPQVIFGVEGSGFLYHMVRNMVGTLLNVGTAYWEPARVSEIITSRDRKMCGPCAPAVGLHLQWIRFP